jgi:hypothetical protein
MKPNQLRAAANATIASIVWVVASTILSEEYAPFKDFLTRTFSHHWVGKGILSLVIWGILYYLFSTRQPYSGKGDVWALSKNVSLTALVGGIVLFLFFVWEWMA